MYILKKSFNKVNGGNMRAPGIYNNINIEAYHSEEGISSTGINLILDCPRRYYYERHEKPKDDKEADHYKLGRALHMLVLEPHLFHGAFYQMTETVDLRTKAGKDAYVKAEIAANGRKILRPGEIADVYGMAKAAAEHPVMGHLKHGLIERSIYWDSGIYNTRLRARPDVFTDEVIVDVKTCKSVDEFKRSIYYRGYHRQAAMQIDALEKIDGKRRHFAFFVIEKTAPYLTACFTLDEASIDQGRREYLDGAATYSECLKSGVWPGYDTTFQLASIPKYCMPKEGDLQAL